MSKQRRERSRAVFGLLIAGGIGIIGSTQTWLTVTRADAGEDILVPGASAVPLLAPLSLAMLALGLALALAGRIVRYVFAVLALGAVAVLFPATLSIVLHPSVDAVASTVTEATGLAGSTGLDSVIGEITASFWPIASLIAWVILFAAAVFILATGHRWQSSGKRYAASTAPASSEGPVDAIDSWDELSRGSDPTR